MSRLEEVESSIRWTMSAGMTGGAITPNMRDLARTLAAEVDARDEVITKLLAMLEVPEDDQEQWAAACGECGWMGMSMSCEANYYEAGDCDVLCPECGAPVDELGCERQVLVARFYARACEIAGRTE